MDELNELNYEWSRVEKQFRKHVKFIDKVLHILVEEALDIEQLKVTLAALGAQNESVLDILTDDDLVSVEEIANALKSVNKNRLLAIEKGN